MARTVAVACLLKSPRRAEYLSFILQDFETGANAQEQKAILTGLYALYATSYMRWDFDALSESMPAFGAAYDRLRSEKRKSPLRDLAKKFRWEK